MGLIPLPGASGRIEPHALALALAEPDVSHHQFATALSLTSAIAYNSFSATVSPFRARSKP